MGRNRRLLPVCALFLAAVLGGCASAPTAGTEDGLETEVAEMQAAVTEQPEPEEVPELAEVRGICRLATMECYYHNVAKSTKEPGSGFAHLGEKERTFWIEYTGIAEISFDLDKVQMELSGTRLTITLPEPQVECRVDPDSWDEDSYAISEDQWIQKNPITAEDQTQAIAEAQDAMQEEVEGDAALLGTATMRAKELIENYISQIGEATGVEYEITWRTLY